MLRNHIKSAVEWALIVAGAPRIKRALRPSTTVILAYHNVVEDHDAGRGDRSLHLARSSFKAQLDDLLRTHEVVPLSSVLDQHRATRPRAVITFDDAYRGAVTAGIEECARRGLPATIFVAPHFVPEETFWWDRLQLSGSAADAALRTQALTQAYGRQAAVLETFADRPTSPLSPSMAVATESELYRAVEQHPGLTFGAHSWSHPNLTRIPDHELDTELRRPLTWLRARFDRVLPWIAYPYGLVSERVTRFAAATGYEGGLRVDGGCIVGGEDPLALPRVNIPAGVSRRGFRLRLDGVTGR